MRVSGIAAALTATVCASSAQASPWNRDDGAVFTSTVANFYVAKTDDAKYERYDSETYLEFGVTPDWMVGGRVSFGTSLTQGVDFGASATGLNEAEIYAQRQIQRGAHSATALKVAGVRSGSLSVDAQTGAPTPNMEIEFRALHGRDLIVAPVKVFATAEAGYRRRFGGDADEIRADALIGVEPSADWLILLEAQSIISLQNERFGYADFDLYKGQASIVWRKSRRWSLVAGARQEFAGRNIETGTGFFLGMWSEF